MNVLKFKYRCAPPTIQNYRRGSALLAVVLVLAVVSSVMSIGTAKITQAAINSTGSNKATLQAQQFASSEAELIKSISYTDLTAQSRADISDSGFQKEVILSDESDYSEQIKQKTATINVYKGSESFPRSTIKLTRYSVEQKASGVPVGTVITWASLNDPKENGTWLECNGQFCTAYPELVKVLGSNTVPDYRGVFLRGLGSVASTSKYYGTVQHQSAALGTLQGDAIRNIYGRFIVDDKVGLGGNGSLYPPSGAFKVVGNDAYYNAYAEWSSPDACVLNFSASYVVPTANEDRPINRAVRYFIKAA